MSITDILIILGCLAGGYWIVSSVMGPGVDTTRRDDNRPPARVTPAAKAPSNPRQEDWHLLLDLQRSASRAEIEAAYRRQLNKALAAQDAPLQEQLRLARDAALAQLSRTDATRPSR
jgi:hypothetical protein